MCYIMVTKYPIKNNLKGNEINLRVWEYAVCHRGGGMDACDNLGSSNVRLWLPISLYLGKTLSRERWKVGLDYKPSMPASWEATSSNKNLTPLGPQPAKTVPPTGHQMFHEPMGDIAPTSHNTLMITLYSFHNGFFICIFYSFVIRQKRNRTLLEFLHY